MTLAAHSPAPSDAELAAVVGDLDPDVEAADITSLPAQDAAAVAFYRVGPLSIRPDQTEPTALQRAAFAELGYTLENGFTDASLMLLMQTAVVSGADPFAQEIILIQTWNVRDDGTRSKGYAVIMAYHHMTARAKRTGQYRGMEGPEFFIGHAEDGAELWSTVWDSPERPVRGRCRVFRESVPDERTPWSIVEWAEVCPQVVPWVETPDGKRRRAPEQGLVDHPRWQQNGLGLFRKCLKAAAHRDQFSDVLGTVYLPEELERTSQAAANAEDEYRRTTSRHDARQHADDIRRLQAIGLAGDVVIADAEANPRPEPAMADEARRQARTAREAAEARVAGRRGTYWADAADDERAAWLWEELETWAELLDVPFTTWTAPLEAIYRRPVTEWGWRDLHGVVRPLRPTVVDALREAGRQAEATALNQVGPDVVAPVTYLLGQDDEG